jgi:serine protease Do
LPAAALGAAEPADEQGVLDQQAFRAAVQRVAPSVVRIETVGGIERLGEILFGSGPTTGLIVAADGTIVSSAFNFLHRPASILVQLADGSRKAARLVATDHNRMIVLLKIEVDKPLPVPEIAPPGELRVGQWTIAVGRTFEGSEPNMAVGVLSATNRIWGKAIQTDAAVSPNNYGGPLIDIRGRVLGVLAPLSPMETTEVAGVEWYDSGIGFAVPTQTVLELLPRLRQGKDLRPGFTGINVSLQTLYTADSVIPAVRPRSPARQAGFRAGDRIVAIDGQKIDLAVQVKQEIGRRYAGDKIRISAIRGTERIERDVELVARLEPYQHPFLGILPMRPSSPGGKGPAAGVKVRYVYADGPAAKAGVQPGDLLVSAGGGSAGDLARLRSRLIELQPGDVLPIEVRRGEQTHKLKVALGDLPETLPIGPLPTAREPRKPSQAKRPQVEVIRLKSADAAEATWAYVPENYDPDLPCGVVVWLPPPGEVKPDAILALWKGPCDRDGLIVVAPQSLGPVRWQPREARLVPLLLAQIAEPYSVDPNRVVVCGRQTGGTVAVLAGFRYAQLVRGVAAVDAPAEGRIPETDPAHRLAFYMATAAKSRAASLIRQSISQLRQMRYPVTTKDLGPEPRDLNADEVAELARWIDTLDRI